MVVMSSRAVTVRMENEAGADEDTSERERLLLIPGLSWDVLPPDATYRRCIIKCMHIMHQVGSYHMQWC